MLVLTVAYGVGADAQVVQGVIPNHGQRPDEVVLQAPIWGGTLWVTRTRLAYDFVEDAPADAREGRGAEPFGADGGWRQGGQAQVATPVGTGRPRPVPPSALDPYER